MKKSDKILVGILFICLNLGALYLISTFFNVGYGILFCAFVGFFACIDLVKRKQNVKILKEQRELQEKQKQQKQQRMLKMEMKAKKKEEALRKQRMREHNRYK